MKKRFLIPIVFAALYSAGSAFADTTEVCVGGAAASGASIPNSTAGTHYMMQPVNVQCSANVFLSGQDGTNGAWYAVGANSVKGKNSFAGSTEGGAVKASAACAKAGGCTQGEAQTARTAANTAASTLAGATN